MVGSRMINFARDTVTQKSEHLIFGHGDRDG